MTKKLFIIFGSFLSISLSSLAQELAKQAKGDLNPFNRTLSFNMLPTATD